MKLFKPETAAPTPLAIGLVVGISLLAFLLSRPDTAAFVLGFPHSIDRLDTGSLGGATGVFLVRNPLVTLALVAAAIGITVARSRRQTAR